MSMINKALRDLDQQKEAYTESVLEPSSVMEADKKSPLGWLLAILVIAVIAVSYFYKESFFSTQQTTKPTPIATKKTIVEVAVEPKAIEQKPIKAINEVIDAEETALLKQQEANEQETELELAKAAAALDVELMDLKSDVDASIAAELVQDEIRVEARVEQELAEAFKQIREQEQAALNLNDLKGLHINEMQNGIELAFKFDKEPVSSVKGYFKDKVVYHLSGASNPLPMPQIESKHWLKSLAVQKSGEGLDITIQRAQNTLLNTRWETTGRDSFWVLSILQKQSLISKNTQAVVTNTDKAAKLKPEIKAETKEKIAVELVKSKPVEKVAQKNSRVSVKPKIFTEKELYQGALRALNKRQLASAENQLRGLLNGQYAIKARLLLINVLSEMGQVTNKNRLLLQSYQNYPENLDFAYLIAKGYFEKAQYQRVVESISKLKEQNYRTLALQGQAYQRLKQYQKAVESFQGSLRLKKQAKIWVSLALSLEKIKRYKDAINAYNNALRDNQLSRKLKQFAQARSKKLQSLL
ncbi:MAG: hypothetical protein ISR69_13165 [Gammaproteobacteria bacterium]|nr:hypothetical protein [Gammaproteobacteria bacterium]